MVPENGARASLVVDGRDRDALEEVAIGPAWLRQVARDQDGSIFRLYRPRPAVAFSGKDCLQEGIGTAVRAASAQSFSPVRRGVGGRAAAYHQGSLGIDHIGSATAGPHDIRERFEVFGSLLMQALRSLGIPAEVGPVPGEYCPGEFSVNDGHGHKLVGTAQRLIRGAWLFTSMIQVNDSARIRAVLDSVYPALGIEWDPASVGSVEDVVPGIAVESVQAAILETYEPWLGPAVGHVPDAVTLAAVQARSTHEVPVGEAVDGGPLRASYLSSSV